MNKIFKYVIWILITIIIIAPILVDWSYEGFDRNLFEFPWDETVMLEYWGVALSAIATVLLGWAVFNQTEKSNEVNLVANFNSLLLIDTVSINIEKNGQKSIINLVIYFESKTLYNPNKIKIKQFDFFDNDGNLLFSMIDNEEKNILLNQTKRSIVDLKKETDLKYQQIKKDLPHVTDIVIAPDNPEYITMYSEFSGKTILSEKNIKDISVIRFNSIYSNSFNVYTIQDNYIELEEYMSGSGSKGEIDVEFRAIRNTISNPTHKLMKKD